MGKRRSSFIASDDSGDERPTKVSKKAKKASASKGAADVTVDAEGNTFWEVRISFPLSVLVVLPLRPPSVLQ